MADKLPLLVLYAGTGLLLALWPLFAWNDFSTRGMALPLGRHPSTDSKWHLAAGVLGGLLMTSVLPWWRHKGGLLPTLSWGEAFVCLLLGTACLFGLLFQSISASGLLKHCWRRHLVTAAFVGLAIFLSFSTLPFAHREVLHFAWHHWGAYIGPTELVLAGARVMRDFPTQYGLGPTVLIASVCGQSCWRGMFHTTALTTFFFALLTAWIAIRTVKPVGTVQRAMVFLLCIACCFFWNAYPTLVGSPLATPSVNGMRFLPVLALTAFLVVVDRAGGKTASFPLGAGHLAWAFCALWSVESAFYATCVWWPCYFMLRQALFDENGWTALLRGSRVLLAVSMAFVGVFVCGYWLVYQTTPTVSGIFAYIASPPGPLPVNYSGALWFFIAVIGVGTWANVQTYKRVGNSAELRRGVALSLLAYATFSYFLGRSHNNNILNLLPFLLLVLLHAYACATGLQQRLATGLTTGLLAGLLGWMGVFGWSAWISGFQNSQQLQWFDANWADRVLQGRGEGLEGNSAVTRSVIAQAQALFPDPVTVAGPTANLSSLDASAVWSALHSPANIHMFASEVRQDFLRRTAETLQRSGWLLVLKNEPIAMGLVPDFDAVYTRTHSFEKSGYLAIHYAPARAVGSSSGTDGKP